MAEAATAKKEFSFTWEGTDKKGNRVSGKTLATSEVAVKAELRRQGILPIKIKKQSALSGAAKGRKITPGDIAVFMRQLATMMKAGVPLVQSFEIVGKGHENPRMQDLILDIKSSVEAGASLTEALRKHYLYFDNLTVNLVEAGEQSGALETLLDKIATYKEKTEAIKKKIKKALTYPIAVLVVAFVVTAVILIYVIPQFESLFQGFGADLPAFTKMVIDLSYFVRDKGYIILIALGGAGYGFVEGKKRSAKFRENLDKLALKMPVIGDILRKAAIARFARTLQTMFAAGVPLVEALESVAGATGNIIYETAILRMRDQVATGQQLNLAMSQTGLFPNMVVQMIAIGEESGAIDTMASKVADFFEQEVDDAVDNLSSLMEPLIMAILGVLVGGLVVAMYLPIFKMGSVV
ncbi:MAG TPA: type II secretion system F family protein [Gammaproteobacteria bacterium]|nr:type II secretion system F family protein [Gammaproteobacteria bacterium]